MLQAISNTSPLLYLYRISLIDRHPEIFGEIWTKGLQRKDVAGFFYSPFTAAPVPWER